MISVRTFDAPEWNYREIMRYARIRGADDTYRALIEECTDEAACHLSYRVCYTYLDVTHDDGSLILKNIRTSSKTLEKAIKGADRVLLFAATVGAPFDRLIQKYSRISPSKALIMQAIGAERVESLCDAFCAYIDTELSVCGKHLTTRVSPGYGDISLEMQRDIFAVLDCPRKIGLTLDESLLMSPSKSVTAISGITDAPVITVADNCALCGKKDCQYKTER